MRNMDSMRSSSRNVFRAFWALVKSLHDFAPQAVYASILLVSLFLWVLMWTKATMVVGVMIVVFVVAFSVYLRTGNFGEASLALVGGIFAAFSLDWTPATFWAFTIVWVTFAGLVFLIESVKMASKLDLTLRASAQKLATSGSSYDDCMTNLKSLLKEPMKGTLGSIERAEVVQAFAYRGMGISSLGKALTTVEQLHVITDLPFLALANAVADIYRAAGDRSADSREDIADLIYINIRDCFAAPRDFLEAISSCRHLLLTGTYELVDFFDGIKKALDSGIAPNRIGEMLSKNNG